jgi:hypothetical protein
VVAGDRDPRHRDPGERGLDARELVGAVGLRDVADDGEEARRLGQRDRLIDRVGEIAAGPRAVAAPPAGAAIVYTPRRSVRAVAVPLSSMTIASGTTGSSSWRSRSPLRSTYTTPVTLTAQAGRLAARQAQAQAAIARRMGPSMGRV